MNISRWDILLLKWLFQMEVFSFSVLFDASAYHLFDKSTDWGLVLFCFVFLMVPNTTIIITRWKKVKKQKSSIFDFLFLIFYFFWFFFLLGKFWSQWVKIDKSGWFDYNNKMFVRFSERRKRRRTREIFLMIF